MITNSAIKMERAIESINVFVMTESKTIEKKIKNKLEYMGFNPEHIQMVEQYKLLKGGNKMDNKLRIENMFSYHKTHPVCPACKVNSHLRNCHQCGNKKNQKKDNSSVFFEILKEKINQR